jgi:small subunit ribosomal protein S1
VFGKVTAVLDTAVMVDLSGKALAIFDRTEMEPDDLVPSTGDRFVARVHQDGARGGLVVLTRKPLREEESKPKLEKAAQEGTLVHGLVTGVIKGGVEVDLGGVRAFAPASGMDLHPANANFSGLVGQQLDFKVSQFDKAGRDVVVTRRPMLEAEAHERRKHALSLLNEGQVMTGVVRTIVEWGVFVALPDAENVEGLIHATEASHDPRPYLSELFKPGDRFDVKILQIDERGKIWLSRKALVEDPWGTARRSSRRARATRARSCASRSSERSSSSRPAWTACCT